MVVVGVQHEVTGQNGVPPFICNRHRLLRTHTPRLAGAAIVPVIHCSPLCTGMREGGTFTYGFDEHAFSTYSCAWEC